MEGVAEDAVSAPKDLSHIAKGKRTKRYRPHSPIPFTIATHSSVDCDMTCMVNLNNLSPSFTDEKGGGTATEEDKDMANCLILLSQGNPIKDSPNMNLDHDLYTPNYGEKFISKRYIEAPMSLNGKTGMYVYQCKTCGRTFLTFQALGGHRASHKKPKNMAANEAKKISSTLALSDNEDESLKINNYKSKKPPALSLELSNRGGAFDITNKSPLQKIHECSYCGAEFTSGQALGGHMRRHRAGVVVAPATPSTNTTLSLSPIPISAAPATPSTNTTLSLSPIPISPAISLNQSDHDPNGKKKVVPLSLDLKMRNAMSLDLNLPAQLEDEHQIQQKHQQVEPEPALVLSTIRFIQCHY